MDTKTPPHDDLLELFHYLPPVEKHILVFYARWRLLKRRLRPLWARYLGGLNKPARWYTLATAVLLWFILPTHARLIYSTIVGGTLSLFVMYKSVRVVAN